MFGFLGRRAPRSRLSSKRKPPRVVVFFGHHKVGSTAIQNTLAKMAPAAARNGVLYPVVTDDDLRVFRWRIRNRWWQPWLPLNVREAHNALAFTLLKEKTGGQIPDWHRNLPDAEHMFSLMREQVNRYNPHTLVLVSEVFANFAAADPRLIGDLFDNLDIDRESADIRLFAYLRRVDDYLASWHGQRVSFGHKVRPLPKGALSNYRKGIHFNYRLMIEGWIEALPNASLTLLPYDSSVRRKGSVAVFAEAMDLALPKLPDAVSSSANPGIHRGLLEIARRANFELPPEEAKALFSALLDLGPKLDLPPSSEVELFGPSARTELIEHFTPIHDWLSEVRGQTFFEDFDRIGQTVAHHEFDVNTTALTQLRQSHLSAFSPAGAEFITGFHPERNFPGFDTDQDKKQGET